MTYDTKRKKKVKLYTAIRAQYAVFCLVFNDDKICY